MTNNKQGIMKRFYNQFGIESKDSEDIWLKSSSGQNIIDPYIYEDLKQFFKTEALEMLGRLDIEEKKAGFMEIAYRDKDYAFIDGFNSAVRLIKDKIKKEKDNLEK